MLASGRTEWSVDNRVRVYGTQGGPGEPDQLSLCAPNVDATRTLLSRI
jgi:hypothetical protein